MTLLKLLPQSRNGAISNKIRQAVRFGEGMKLSARERYWRWAIFADRSEATQLLNEKSLSRLSQDRFESLKQNWLEPIDSNAGMNDVFLADMQLVLPNDMLTKVDLMSMANSLEVRTPFLDFELVNFIFSLPADFKINKSIRKRILQDSFREMLPSELYNRPKKGFEVPMLKWLRREMKSLINDDLLSEKMITEQAIFNYTEIQKLKQQLFSSNPGDVHARIWGLIVFQWWWRRSIL